MDSRLSNSAEADCFGPRLGDKAGATLGTRSHVAVDALEMPGRAGGADGSMGAAQASHRAGTRIPRDGGMGLALMGDGRSAIAWRVLAE